MKPNYRNNIWQVVDGSIIGSYRLYDNIELLLGVKVVYTKQIR